MARWRTKGCPRCDGDMLTNRDLYGWFEQCLQCGYIHDLRSTVKLGQQQAYSKKEEAEGSRL